MKEAIYDYDPAPALDGPETMDIFMTGAFETGGAQYIAKAMGVVARAKGMTEQACEKGLSREQPYRSFSDKGTPRSTLCWPL